jgi:hypothetical protein
METAKKQESKMDMQTMMQVYTKVGTPGAPHKLLARLAGNWTTRTKSWMDPNEPPMESTGTCQQKMLFDGRYLHQEYAGDMMGSPFAGVNLIGYDNHTGKIRFDLDRFHEHRHLLFRGNRQR